MKWLLRIFFWLAIGMAIAYFASRNVGHVMIYTGDWSRWTIEMTFPMFLLVVALVVVICHYIYQAFARTWGVRSAMGSWFASRKDRGARRRLNQGLVKLYEGAYDEAQKKLLADIERSESPALNYLAAAMAAQGKGDITARDDYLKKAHGARQAPEFAVTLMQAKMQIEQEQFEDAVIKLERLNKAKPHHPPVVLAMLTCYQHLGDWGAMIELLPIARKRAMMEVQEAQALEALAASNLLKSTNNSTVEVQQSVWGQLSKEVQMHPDVIAAHVQNLIDNDAAEAAEQYLREALQREFHSGLLRMYGNLKTPRPEKQLAAVEHWLKDQGDNPELLLVAGKLSMRIDAMPRAENYLKTSADISPRLETLRQLGELLESLGRDTEACEAYKKAALI